METWKDIPDYEGIYEVSDKGRVRTTENKITYSELHGERKWKQRILKQKSDPGGHKLDTRRLTPVEVRRLIRIAESGMRVRFAVEKWLADIKRREAEKIADKTINNGLKYSEIYRRLTSLLRGMR